MASPVRLRLAESRDAPALAEIYAPAVTERATSFELIPPAPEEMSRRIGASHPKFPWLVAERDGQVLGYAYASRHHDDRAGYAWSVDVSVYVSTHAHRQGIGRALYAAILPILSLQGFRQAYAGVVLPNPASVGLHEAMGFRRIGVYEGVGYKLGQWHDVAWFGRALGPRVQDPPPPRTIEEARALPAWSDTIPWSST